MHVRMVPVQTVFSKFPRLIRDLSRKSGKKVELITEGEETELDKLRWWRSLAIRWCICCATPWIMVWNMPKCVLPRAKAETGRVWLRAFHKGNSVLIEVEDDGKGIDPDVMRRKAIEKAPVNNGDKPPTTTPLHINFDKSKK